MNIQIGQNAPQFELLDQTGKSHSLSGYLGKWLLIYFYPEDETSGCTLEACGMQNVLPNFHSLELNVLGISKDSVESHKNFAEKHSLTFPLLADVNKTVIDAYDVAGGYNGGAKRTSFLINPKGEVVKIYENVDPENHSTEVIKDFQLLNK
jgi:peroxiredoxin Q/BCP